MRVDILRRSRRKPISVCPAFGCETTAGSMGGDGGDDATRAAKAFCIISNELGETTRMWSSGKGVRLSGQWPATLSTALMASYVFAEDDSFSGGSIVPRRAGAGAVEGGCTRASAEEELRKVRINHHVRFQEGTGREPIRCGLRQPALELCKDMGWEATSNRFTPSSLTVKLTCDCCSGPSRTLPQQMRASAIHLRPHGGLHAAALF